MLLVRIGVVCDTRRAAMRVDVGPGRELLEGGFVPAAEHEELLERVAQLEAAEDGQREALTAQLRANITAAVRGEMIQLKQDFAQLRQQNIEMVAELSELRRVAQTRG